jgi:carboxypeptidase D
MHRRIHVLTRLTATIFGSAMMLGSATARADTWTDYDDIGPTFAAFEAAYPNICERHDLGLSVQGRHIWAIRISDNIHLEEDEPEFKYISTMHGDEIVGVKMCMNLVNLLLTGYGADQRITILVNELDIWIVPLMNPDGYDRSPRSRYNAHGIDLNRNFPDPFVDPDPGTTGREPETAVIMNWSAAHSFTLAANFHGGALVANYPYDNNATGASVYTASPDDDLYIWISEEYSRHNPPMWASPSFYHGITNGAAWYAIDGGMQDWNYRYLRCNEVTLEIGDTKQPSATLIPTFWNENRESMLAYLETCLIGVRGIVTDADTGEPLAAAVRVVGRENYVYTDPDVGDYHRMLLPGTYDLVISAEGYDPVTVNNVSVLSAGATRVNVSLLPGPSITTPSLPMGREGAPYGPVQLAVEGGQEPMSWAVLSEEGYEESSLGECLFTSGGTAKGWHDDEKAWSYDLPFTFPYYGRNYTQIRVWSNGFIDFGAFSGSAYDNTTQKLINNRMIAPLWDDLRTDRGGGDVFIDTTTPNQVTIRWAAVTYSTEYPVNTAVTLHADGKIEFHYGSGNASISATVGISDGDGGLYTLSVYNPAYTMTYADSVRYVQRSALPDGMTFSHTGRLAGTPSEAGTFEPTFTVTDALGGTDSKTYTLVIHEGSSVTGDCDADGDVDLADFAVFQWCFGSPASGVCGEAFEFVEDGIINLADYSEIAQRRLGPS